MYNRYYENVTEAVALNDREVEFRFDQKGNRELPKIIGDLVVLPKHWWEGTDASGKKRDITQPTLEPPLGSAAYKIESFKPGAEIVWTRVQGLLGREAAGEDRPREFRPAPLSSISRTTMPSGRPSQRAAYEDIQAGKPRAAMGDASTISRPSKRAM